jgi:hypothetical protein
MKRCRVFTWAGAIVIGATALVFTARADGPRGAAATQPSRDALADEIRQLREQVAAMSREVAGLRERMTPAAAVATTRPAEPPHEAKFTLEIVAAIDGSDELRITRDGLSWSHKQWSWPENVTINGHPWDPHDDLKWDVLGAAPVDDTSPVKLARIVDRDGRDTLAVESDPGGVTVYYADTLEGADTYTVKIELRGLKQKGGE